MKYIMKSSMLVSALFAMVLIFTTVSTPAYAFGQDDLAEACKDFQEADPAIFDLFYSNIGDCVSNNNLNAAIAEFCREYSELFGFKNRGQCVSELQAWYRAYFG